MTHWHEAGKGPGFIRTVWTLLRASYRRSAGRKKRQAQLLYQRAGRKARNWGAFGMVVAIVWMAMINGFAAYILDIVVTSGEVIQLENSGKNPVSSRFIQSVHLAQQTVATGGTLTIGEVLALDIHYEAHRRSASDAVQTKAIAARLENDISLHGDTNLIDIAEAAPGLSRASCFGAIPAMLGGLVLFWWGLMLVFQGEGLELDLQRRRHPMWEWLLAHPVPPGAVFLAEMISPIAANPMYCGAPCFTGLVYGLTYGAWPGICAAVIIGIPLAVAAACVGKALETAAVLRFSARTRGAMVGFMSWLGYASFMLTILGGFMIPKMVYPLAHLLEPLAVLPWPWLGLFLGFHGHGEASCVLGMTTCLGAAIATIGAAIWFCAWAAQRGLSGNSAAATVVVAAHHRVHFGKEPLYRKEFLWFIRDRSAIIQIFLFPLTIAAVQLFNLRGLLHEAQAAWNYLCGAGILLGTYFLWVLGPKSLASEGAALWITLTWPRGLESLLKAKAWLWSMLSSILVVLTLVYAAILYPQAIWKIAMVGIGWFFFAHSMAEKAVTLVTVTAESGEQQRIPRMRQWAASLGMLTFSIGILTQQWNIAIMGIVYSYMTAAAMWENFRARLPYLFDPWSEKLPTPPTLTHAMIAISILVEGGAVLSAIALGIAGRANLATTQVVVYGFCAALVSLGVMRFLRNRGVSNRSIWNWSGAPRVDAWHQRWIDRGMADRGLFVALGMGAIGGLILAGLAVGYLALIAHLPLLGDQLRHAAEQAAKSPDLQRSYAIMAICVAPFAEEYLFRGLLFRALDREWGGWRALVGSAAFFAVYHPLLAWPPVFLVGMSNALLFKQTGRLAPAVLLHLVYNAVVVTYS
jgi:membrane protease YdiL (CAAX protease family)